MEFDLNAYENRAGDVAIVTGANSGVGYEVTVGLVKKGIHVVMACRDLKKAKAAKEKIEQRVLGAKLEIIVLDLSDFDSVKNFVLNFKSKHQKLNILINNAGILFEESVKNKDGIELQFATNHLGHFLLTSQLIDIMPDTNKTRIVSISSVAHKKSKIYLDDINLENQTRLNIAYGQSKLACLMFADELHRKLQSSHKQMKSLASHPGGTDTALFDNLPKAFHLLLKFVYVPLFLHSNKNAAKPILLAALDKNIEGGEYFGPIGLLDMKGPPGIANRTEYSKDPAVANQLWKLSEKMTGESFSV